MKRICAYRYCASKMNKRPDSQRYCSASCRHSALGLKWEIVPGALCLYCGERVVGRSGNTSCNKEECRRSNAAWNCAFRSTDGRIDRVYLPDVFAKSGGRCDECGLALDALIELDHIVPRHRGGDHTIGNLHFLHKQCHVKKTARDRATA